MGALKREMEVYSRVNLAGKIMSPVLDTLSLRAWWDSEVKIPRRREAVELRRGTEPWSMEGGIIYRRGNLHVGGD